jgi:hypothetical protein
MVTLSPNFKVISLEQLKIEILFTDIYLHVSSAIYALEEHGDRSHHLPDSAEYIV